MSMRDALDISSYLVIGPENTCGRPVGDVISAALAAGFTCVQVRSKVCSARELMACADEAARAIERAGASEKVALLIDDRLDVAFAAREAGVKVDGVHVGQSDVPVEACRKLLGPDAVVGLSARADEMLEYVKTADMSLVDYLGVGPLHETPTKRDCGLAADGTIITKSIDDLRELAVASPVPIVVGGGVKVADIPLVAQTGVDGFFVVSAVCGASDPEAAARELVCAWREAKGSEGELSQPQSARKGIMGEADIVSVSNQQQRATQRTKGARDDLHGSHQGIPWHGCGVHLHVR